MQVRLLYFAVTIVCLTTTAPAQRSKIIDLRSADTLKVKTINREEVRELVGNVHFVQIATEGGLVKVWCDRALQFIIQK